MRRISSDTVRNPSAQFRGWIVCVGDFHSEILNCLLKFPTTYLRADIKLFILFKVIQVFKIANPLLLLNPPAEAVFTSIWWLNIPKYMKLKPGISCSDIIILISTILIMILIKHNPILTGKSLHSFYDYVSISLHYNR